MKTYGSSTIDVPHDVVKALDSLSSAIMISHVVPDADALGSMFAIARAYQNGDKKPKVSLPEGSLSARLAFLFEMADVTVADDGDFESADGFVVLDTAKKPRSNVGASLKTSDWSNGRPILNIDHHSSNTNFGSVNWIVHEAGSTCELVYYLLRVCDRPIDSVTASLLYAGILTDTLGFSLPTTTPAALLAASELADRGGDVALLGERLFRAQSPAEFSLLRVIYANTKVVADGRIAYSSAGFDEIRDAGCTAADIDDQISVPRSLDGAVMALLFTEGRKGKTRINFRGSGSLTVVGLAGEFGGGGHDQAAGAILNCPIEEAVAKVIPLAVKHLDNFDL